MENKNVLLIKNFGDDITNVTIKTEYPEQIKLKITNSRKKDTVTIDLSILYNDEDAFEDVDNNTRIKYVTKEKEGNLYIVDFVYWNLCSLSSVTKIEIYDCHRVNEFYAMSRGNFFYNFNMVYLKENYSSYKRYFKNTFIIIIDQTYIDLYTTNEKLQYAKNLIL